MFFTNKHRKNASQKRVHKRRGAIASFLSSTLSAVHPVVLLFMGAVNFFAFLFQASLYGRLILVGIFYILASSQKRVRISYYIFFIASIVFFSLLLPSGKLLYTIGPLRITQGALEEGVFRGITLSAYVFLSLWAISPHLSLPGYGGKVLSVSLRLFALLFESKDTIVSQSSPSDDQKDTEMIQAQQHSPSVPLFVKVDMFLCNVLEKYHLQQTQKQSNTTASASRGMHRASYDTKKSMIGLSVLCIVSSIAWGLFFYTV